MAGENINEDVIDQIFGKDEEEDKVGTGTVETAPEPVAEPTEPAPTVEPAQTTQSDAEKTAQNEKKVDYGALYAERMKRKEADAKIAELQKQLDEVRKPAPVQAPANATPAEKALYETNPNEALRQAILLQQEHINQMQQDWQARQEEAQAERQVNELASAYTQAGVEYAQTNPEYQEAYKHIVGIKADELKLQGFQGDELKRELLSWELRMAYDAYQAEMNPHERFYELAKAYRFTPSAPALPQGIQPANPNSKLNTVRQGMKDNKVLPNSRGEVLTSEPEYGTSIEDMLPFGKKRTSR